MLYIRIYIIQPFFFSYFFLAFFTPQYILIHYVEICCSFLKLGFSFYSQEVIFITQVPKYNGIITRLFRTFTQSAVARNAAGLPTSLQAFTEDEMMLRDAGNLFLIVLRNMVAKLVT